MRHPEIFIINLSESHARREQITHQLEPIGIQHEFFAALTPDTSHQQINAVNQKRARLILGRQLSATEIACYASHMALWKRCIANNRPMIILEDDAVFYGDTISGLNSVSKLIKQFDYLRLEGDYPDGKRITTQGNFAARWMFRPPYCACAYAITPRGAQQFIDASAVVSMPVDYFFKRCWLHGVAPVVQNPGLACQKGQGSVSTIMERELTDFSWHLQVRRQLFKALNWVRRARFNRRAFHTNVSHNITNEGGNPTPTSW